MLVLQGNLQREQSYDQGINMMHSYPALHHVVLASNREVDMHRGLSSSSGFKKHCKTCEEFLTLHTQLHYRKIASITVCR